MKTRSDIAQALKGANVEAPAAAAGVSTKTIYRMRRPREDDKLSPTLRTVEKVLAALAAMKVASKRRGKAGTGAQA